MRIQEQDRINAYIAFMSAAIQALTPDVKVTTRLDAELIASWARHITNKALSEMEKDLS